MQPRRIVAGVTALLLLAAGTGVLAAIADDRPARTSDPRQSLAADVIGVRTAASTSYLVVNGRQALLIDAGSDRTGKEILETLGSRGLRAEDVAAVLLTHGHRQALAAAALFPQATTYVGEADYGLVAGDRSPVPLLARLANATLPKPKPPLRLRVVLPGELVQAAGLVLAAVATPGHTAGSMMYLYRDILFTGGGLRVRGHGLALPPCYLDERPAEARRSLSRLRELPFDTIADGLGGVAVDGRQRLAALLGDAK
jgi:hydroxyacylglutathione hydrolase